MHRFLAAVALAILGGCETSEPAEKVYDPYRDVARDTSVQQAESDPEVIETVFDRLDYQEMDRYNGKYISLRGTFDHQRAIHGTLRLEGGMVITIPHFDQFQRGDDWLKYVGKRCTATGILHTYTRNHEPYRAPTLQISEFSGPGE